MTTIRFGATAVGVPTGFNGWHDAIKLAEEDMGALGVPKKVQQRLVTAALRELQADALCRHSVQDGPESSTVFIGPEGAVAKAVDTATQRALAQVLKANQKGKAASPTTIANYLNFSTLLDAVTAKWGSAEERKILLAAIAPKVAEEAKAMTKRAKELAAAVVGLAEENAVLRSELEAVAFEQMMSQFDQAIRDLLKNQKNKPEGGQGGQDAPQV